MDREIAKEVEKECYELLEKVQSCWFVEHRQVLSLGNIYMTHLAYCDESVTHTSVSVQQIRKNAIP